LGRLPDELVDPLVDGTTEGGVEVSEVVWGDEVADDVGVLPATSSADPQAASNTALTTPAVMARPLRNLIGYLSELLWGEMEGLRYLATEPSRSE
jgi:hypothetical protein